MGDCAKRNFRKGLKYAARNSFRDLHSRSGSGLPVLPGCFRLEVQKIEGGPIDYWLVTTGDDKDPGINGGLARPREGQSPGTINTIAVPSLDQSIKKIEQRGGRVCVPKMEIPNIGWLAYAEDPAGNVFGVIEPHSTAK